MKRPRYINSLPDEIFDESSKLLKCQREQLKIWKEKYKLSYASVAENYNIGKSTAYYICNPDKAEEKNEKWKKDAHKYYDKDRALASAAKSRKKLRELGEKFKLAS